MLPSEKIELAIYKCIKPLGSAVTMNLGMLSAATGEDYQTIVERLESLQSNKRIALFKHVEGTRLPFAGQWGENKKGFFYEGSFVIEIVPDGRSYFERLEQLVEQESQRRLVFISCGQFTEKEIALGKKLALAVTDNTSSEGYFAETQNSLENLSRNIFSALNQCAGLVVVMHHRGQVETLDGEKHIRASVWIEQEIAIAAFLVEVHRKHIPVALYVQKGIKREGVRDLLRIGPFYFADEAEVLNDFQNRLKAETFKPGSETQRTSDGDRRNSQKLRERGEELHSLFTQWINALGAHYLRRAAVMRGKLTYNQCFDLDIKEGKPPYDFSRIDFLIDVDFPSMRLLYNQIIAERSKLNKIEAAFRRSYDDGNVDGEEFIRPYLEVQKSIEALAEAFQQEIRDRSRNVDA